MGEYTRLWAEQQFGPEHAPAIADILAKYAKYNARRKPELLAPETYSVVNYREADRVDTVRKKSPTGKIPTVVLEDGRALPSDCTR